MRVVVQIAKDAKCVIDNKTYITVPLAMAQTSDNQPTFWTGGLRLNIAGNNLV